MKLPTKSVKFLAALLPAGFLGMSAALASTAPATEADPAADSQGVANRLAAIRDAVSSVTDQGIAEDPLAIDQNKDNMRVAWWANRAGWHRHPGWRNVAWRNGGWRNGGWRNWHNGWRNGWRNF